MNWYLTIPFSVTQIISDSTDSTCNLSHVTLELRSVVVFAMIVSSVSNEDIFLHDVKVCLRPVSVTKCQLPLVSQAFLSS
jgi:hypothetical protein